MNCHPLNIVKGILVLLLSTVGLAVPLSTGAAQDRPVVLLIARGDNPPLGEASLKVAIDKEVNTIINKLNGLGYTVDVASEDGKDITAAGSTLKVDKKLADVQTKNYAGVIIPCMSHVNVPTEAVKIVQDLQSRNLPVAAQNGGVIVCDAAGALKGRNYAIAPELKSFVHHDQDGVLKGTGVVRDGDIVTSGVCPYYAEGLVTTFAAMLKK